MPPNGTYLEGPIALVEKLSPLHPLSFHLFQSRTSSSKAHLCQHTSSMPRQATKGSEHSHSRAQPAAKVKALTKHGPSLPYYLLYDNTCQLYVTDVVSTLTGSVARLHVSPSFSCLKEQTRGPLSPAIGVQENAAAAQKAPEAQCLGLGAGLAS